MDDLDSELRLGYLIHDVSRLRRTLFDRWLSPLGITRSQWWVLAFVSREDGRPQTDLAVELDIGKVALGALIDRLETSGFVERRPDPNDRRIKRVFLTAQSRRTLEVLRKNNAAFNKRVNAGLSPEAVDVTAKTLRRMKRNIIEASKDLELNPALPTQPGRKAAGPAEGSAIRGRAAKPPAANKAAAGKLALEPASSG